MDIELQAVSGLKAGIEKDCTASGFPERKRDVFVCRGGDYVMIYI